MATITYNPLVEDARRKMGGVVLSKWKSTNYFRKYRAPGGEPSAMQVEVRSVFSTLVEIWQGLGGAFRASWNNYAKKLNMTGYNAFIGRNSNRLRAGEALELFRELGEAPLVSLAASPGAAGAVQCGFEKPADFAEKHVVFFTQRMAEGRGTAEVRIHEAGQDPASPFAVTGLEPGAEYFVYAVAADSSYAEAVAISSALSASSAAGA